MQERMYGRKSRFIGCIGSLPVRQADFGHFISPATLPRMKVSLEWLSDFVQFTERDPQKIADRLTESTGEIDDVVSQGVHLAHCVVGKVLKIRKHPNADKLILADVETDRGIKKVVCGGTNLREGMTVAFAHTGARVKWHGAEMVTLQKTKIRGEESEGMICAAEELELQDHFSSRPEDGDRPIVDMGLSDSDVGKPIASVLNLKDTVFHIDNHAITHRADLFSHLGIARECVALGLATWKPKTQNLKLKTFPKTPLSFRFINDIPKLLTRFDGCLLTIDGLGQTPDWMKRRLQATGWRLVNLPVDITNYVAMEMGVPLHSFDRTDLKGDIRAHLSKEGEKITTLDGVERPLPHGGIVLSDDEGIFDLLGIMGGLRSSTKDSTKEIYLHAPVVDAATIRKTIIATGLRTDAATVYEKGVPRVMVRPAILRALELFSELIPGTKILSKLESQGDDGKANAIALDLARASSVLGTDLSESQVTKIFKDLEFTVRKGAKKKTTNYKLPTTNFVVTPPLHRLGDVRGQHDLIEEIGRIIGYNTIQTSMPMADVQLPKRDQRIHQLRDSLKEDGYVEILPLAFTSRQLLESCGLDSHHAVEVANPLGEELGILRTSLLPGLLVHAQQNLQQAEHRLRAFQWGHVFHREKGEWSELSMLISTRSETGLLDDPFLKTKQHLHNALSAINFSPEITPVVQTPAYAHPGRYGNIAVLGTVLGEIYEVHPRIRERFDIAGRAACATINLTKLLELESRARIASPLSQFPAITYDVTIPVKRYDRFGSLVTELQEKSEILESVTIHDLYSAPGIHDEYYLTLRFIYRASDRTLTENEATAAHSKVSKLLERFKYITVKP